jgi:CHAT domain-containing protein
MRSFDASARRRWGLGVAKAIVVATATFFAARLVQMVEREWAVERLLSSLDDPAVLGVRLSSPRFRTHDSGARPSAAASDVLLAGGDEKTAEARHAVGIAMLIAGREEEAVRDLRRLAVEAPTGRRWSDVAAAELVAARHDPGRSLLTALTAIERSVALDPQLPEALFNRATILEALGLREVAAEEWRHFLQVERHGSWAVEARKRLAKHESAHTANEEWESYRSRLAELPKHELEQLVLRFPAKTRVAAEGLLVQWADASLSGHAPHAEQVLDSAYVIGAALRSRSGDSFTLRAVAMTRAATGTSRRTVGEALLRYGEGRRLLMAGEHRDAARALDEARVAFARLGQPMEKIAAFWSAVALKYDNQTALAELQFIELLRHCNPVEDASLRAEIQAALTLCHGAAGQWQAASQSASEAAGLFRRIGETESAASVGIAVIGILSLTGQRAEARRYALDVIRELAAAGNEERLAAAFTAAGHAEVRRGDWETALALASIELRLPYTQSKPVFLTDVYMRRAAALVQLGQSGRALASLKAARSAALELPPGGQRAQTLADIDGVQGAMLRRTNPRAALPLLTRSIDFQLTAVRLFTLPKLYLERGRAYTAVNRIADAANDYAAGIHVLEQQRSNAVERWQQIGIFDNTSALFDEAAELALRGNDIERAFRTVERRRARALLDELVAENSRVPQQAADSRYLRGALPTDVVVIEYAKIGRRFVAFVLTRDRLEARRLPADADSLAQEVRGVAHALSDGRDAGAHLRKLRTVLIDPLRDWLAGRGTVVIVPDPIVQRVPFTALIDGRTKQYLVEQYRVLVEPSVATYAASRERPAATTTLPQVAAFGNPALVSSDFESLPQSELEAVFVGRRHLRSKVRLGGDATKARFLDALMTCDAVHYAGHATNSALEPWQSALLLASPDGELTAREIVQLQAIKARLVVLAACSTAGDISVEGSPVLAHAFLIAGVPTVIGTLWDIEDGDSGPLMFALHERLAKGMTPVEALRDAQLSLLLSPRPEYRHPSRWAAFVVYGAS